MRCTLAFRHVVRPPCSLNTGCKSYTGCAIMCCCLCDSWLPYTHHWAPFAHLVVRRSWISSWTDAAAAAGAAGPAARAGHLPTRSATRTQRNQSHPARLRARSQARDRQHPCGRAAMSSQCRGTALSSPSGLLSDSSPLRLGLTGNKMDNCSIDYICIHGSGIGVAAILQRILPVPRSEGTTCAAVQWLMQLHTRQAVSWFLM